MRQKITHLFTAFLITVLLAGPLCLSAQVIFSEDFDGVGGPVGGGAGTYSFPAGWLLRNVDNRTPATAVNYVNDAWERREDFIIEFDSCAFSTSWYTPAGAADDWMWTPLIAISANCVLKWKGLAPDPSYPDGYTVRIMTQSSTPGGPTGGTGTIGNQITNSTLLTTVPAESDTWTSRQLSLSAYAGQSVWIAFRNNSNDMFLLMIDDVSVEVQVNYDASVTSCDTLSEYTIIPEQQVTSLPLGGTISNIGLLNVTNVQLKANVYNSLGALVYTNTSTSFATLTPGASNHFTCGSFTPASQDFFYAEYISIITQSDQNVLNDTLLEPWGVIISDTIYARDNGLVTGALGIGAGNGGYLGQMFTIVSATDLRSISAYVTAGYTGEPLALCLWNMAGGTPNVIIAATDTLLYPDDSARLYTIPMYGGNFPLAPGDYTFTMIEFDSTVATGQTADKFILGTTWVDWPTNPLGGWANNEDFGVGFAKPYVIRPNLYTCPVIAANQNTTDATCAVCTDGGASVAPAGGTLPYSYVWNNGSTTSSITGVLPGSYTVTITDAMGCQVIENITIGFTTGIEVIQPSPLTVMPNPSHGIFTISASWAISEDVSFEIYNMIGEKVYNSNIINAEFINERVDLGGITPGQYMMRFTHGNQTELIKIIIE